MQSRNIDTKLRGIRSSRQRPFSWAERMCIISALFPWETYYFSALSQQRNLFCLPGKKRFFSAAYYHLLRGGVPLRHTSGRRSIRRGTRWEGPDLPCIFRYEWISRRTKEGREPYGRKIGGASSGAGHPAALRRRRHPLKNGSIRK